MSRLLRSRSVRVVLQLIVPVALITLWWFTSRDSRSLYYPPLSKVLTSLRKEWLFARVGSDLVPSLLRFGVGYLLAALIGIAAGTAIGLSPRLRLLTRPATEMLRAIPPPLLLPFVFVTLGSSDTARVAVIALGSVWPVLLNVIDGVRGVDPVTLDMAASFRLSRAVRIRRVVLPAAGPQIAVGLRTGLAVALIMMIISEMQGAANGLGFRVLSAQRSFDTPAMFAGIIVIGVVGLVVNLAFVLVERWALRWYRGARGRSGEDAPPVRAARRHRASPTTPPSPARHLGAASAAPTGA
jgi:ABC-type nitrate/sulfonate/bicarbonate transport system permease component